MRYAVTVNRKYQYVKVYNVVKRINEKSVNPLTKAASSFMERLLLKKKGPGQV